MQTLHNPFWWLPGDSIKWPSDDEKLCLVNDWVKDVDNVCKFVDNFGAVIQAGGACGIWPARLASYFKFVYTFEPHPDNFACLVENTSPFKNVFTHRAGLGKECGTGSLKRDAFEDHNAGAWYMVDGDEFQVFTIDMFATYEVGLIMLDVEGAELDVLKGGEKTILKSNPVVCIEQKQLPHMKTTATAAGEYLKSLGYELVAQFHNDYVYK